jgi:superfamily II DNA or RNA helicase/uncharacterized protein (DUF736 family)
MKRMTEKVLIKTDPALKNRPYQVESLMNILNSESKNCLVKMFCGTGKSRIITNVIIHEKKTLNVIVFPSLALINQYSMDYLNNDEYKKHFKKHKKINVSSEILTTTESTTDPKKIKNFLKLKTHKIILVTYQSYQVLLNCLDGMKIGLVCYDEAHHVVSPEYQKLVFETDYFEKEVFFTATPRNENGIIMYDVDEPENNMCGELAYDYTYLQGLNDEVLNSFEVCIDMYTENSNNSIYQALARAILARNTSRVLSFHSGVNGESNTNVWNFVNFEIFQAVFYEVQRNEFPEKEGYYTKITFKGIDGEIPSSVRKAMLLELDETPDNEIYILSSCETIGEGVDTKNANMCLFADPKTSVVKIIQNIGRVVRRNKNHPLSTVLIPCWINMENYAEANGDTEKQDELIRQQMRMPNGDYASILNVLGALKQEDPELYEMCLNNHSNRRHKEKSLEKQKFQILDDEEDEFYETYDSEEVQQMKEEGEIPLEIHTNETIERFNEDVDDELLLRLYHDEENNIYKPIIRTDEEVDDRQIIQPPTKATSNVKMSIIHKNDDIQMLWSVSSELDFSKKFCSAIIACEVSYGVEQWCLTLQQVCEYMDDEEKAPSQIDKNSEIKKLGNWVSAQKQNYAKNRYIMKNPEIRTKWEATLEKYKEYLCETDEKWYLTLQKVCKYIDHEKKTPSQYDKIPEIRKLGNWVSTQKQNYAKNAQIMSRNPEIRTKWEETLEKYKEYLCIDLDEQWHLTLQQVCEYMDDEENNKAPSQKDKNPEIRKLGNWVSRQKKSYSRNACIMKKPEIRIKWEETLEKYKEYLCIDLDEQWHFTLQKVCEYMDDNKKAPSQKDKNPEIKKLGNWVYTQKQNYDKNDRIMKNPEIRSKWEATLEKYKDYLCIDLEEQWHLTLQEVCEYMDDEENNKAPSQKDKNPEIRKLGKWVSHQKENYSKNRYIMKNPEIRTKWEETLEKYKDYLCIDLEEQWHLTLQEVCEYMDDEENNKAPSQSDKNPEIRKLGRWVSQQKQNYSKNRYIMKNPEIRSKWEATLEKYKEHLCDADEQWHLTHQEVCKYMDDEENNKAPSQYDKNPEIKKLGIWVQNQKRNYAKNDWIMKNPEIRTKWEETLEKYKDYLKQEIIPIQSDEQKPEEKFIIKIKNKKKIIKKQKTIIPTSSNTDISTIENQTTHHFPQQPSDIGQLHKTYLRMRSDNLHQKFKENPQLWQEYHAIRKNTFAHYDHDSIPSNRIIRKLEKIKTKHKKNVVDMGCGQAPIAHHFLEKNDPRFTFHNYDHISGGDTIIQEVNISHLTEEDSSVDIAIMSLALWGTQEDCTQYIKEAYRILESGGKFYICDSTKKWSPELMTQENGGELLRKMLIENGFTIIHEEIGNPFCLFECYKNY